MQKEFFVRLNKPLNALLTPAIALAFIGGVSSAAHAEAADPLSASEAADLAYVRANLSEKGVAPATVDTLIEKLRRGESLDADTGAEAVSTRTFTDRLGQHTIYTYADGSAAEGIVEVPTAPAPGRAGAFKIGGCQKTVSRDVHTFKGCKVSWDAATWSMSYTASYEYYQFGASITKLSGITIGGIGMDNEGTEIIEGRAQGRSAIAHGRGYAKQKISIAGVGVNRTVGIDLKVSAAWGKAKESSFGG